MFRNEVWSQKSIRNKYKGINTHSCSDVLNLSTLKYCPTLEIIFLPLYY